MLPWLTRPMRASGTELLICVLAAAGAPAAGWSQPPLPAEPWAAADPAPAPNFPLGQPPPTAFAVPVGPPPAFAFPVAPPPAFAVPVAPPPAGGVAPLDAVFQPGPDYAPPGTQPRSYQDAPGLPIYRSDFDRESDPILEYVYDPDYYTDPWDRVHQVADYAPPGYEARDYQSAPGDPEYSPITPPVRVSQEEREKFVVGGVVPGSFLAPGTNTSFRLRGFVRLAALYDLDPIGLRDAFPTNTIPVPQTEGQNFNVSARISRFALESWTPTDWCERTIHTFIEGDFFNGPDQAVGGGGNPFRLRHAFVDVGWFRFGQQNSVFMDGTNWPSLVDFQGPNSWVNQRQPLARLTMPVAERLYWATSLERPFSNIATNGLGDQVQDVPDLATHVRLEGDRGHLQLAGLVRAIGYRPTGGEVTRRAGSGISGSAVFHPWAFVFGTDPVHEINPSGLTRSRILLQGTWGAGIARYINDLAGQSLDGQVDPFTGRFDTVDVTAWNASYEHWLNERWLSNVTYAQVLTASNPNQPAATYASGQYVAVSVWWIPITRMSLGVEYLWGEREHVDGLSAQANRVHGLFQYNF